MFISGILSLVVTAILASMILLEWGARTEPVLAKASAKRLTHFAELFLLACIVLCNAIIWIPMFLR
jgi:hypothetical protein